MSGAVSPSTLDRTAPLLGGRVKALSDAILAGPLATRALATWCGAHGIGDGPITVRRLEVERLPSLDSDGLLALSPAGTMIAFRRVEIRRGPIVLVDADNWYLPDRLPPALVERLATAQPFGEVIAPLGPVRETRLVRALDGPHVLEHRAVVRLGDGRAVALVHERYRAVLVD